MRRHRCARGGRLPSSRQWLTRAWRVRGWRRHRSACELKVGQTASGQDHPFEVALALPLAEAERADGRPPRYGSTRRRLSGLLPAARGDERRRRFDELDVTLIFGVAGPPARTTITVPAGFELFAARPPGTFIGEVDIFASSGNYGASAL